MGKSIKVGFCVAYDWYYLEYSLPLIYNAADVIYLSLDKDRMSWTGKRFEFDEDNFNKLIQRMDVDKKIILYQDDFHQPDLNPMENEVRQRNLMAEQMGVDGSWHIQLDADEYFVDFRGFVKYLNNFSTNKPVNICCPFYIVFKQVQNAYLLIQANKLDQIEFIPIATNKPFYQFGRRNGYFNVKTDFLVLHQSWARSESEIFQKISNWGHKEDFDVMSYFEKWKTLSLSNYLSFKNFHPIQSNNWEGLEKIESENIGQLIEKLGSNPPFQIDNFYLSKENSMWLSRAKSLLKRLSK